MLRDEAIKTIEDHYGFPEGFDSDDYTSSGIEKLANQRLMESNAAFAQRQQFHAQQR